MALPAKTEVDAIFSKLSDAVNAYDPNPGLDGGASRAQIRELAKRLFLSTMTPGEQGIQHCKDVSLLQSIGATLTWTDDRVGGSTNCHETRTHKESP